MRSHLRRAAARSQQAAGESIETEPTISQINGVVVKALAKPAIRERIAGFAAEVAGGTPEELGVFVKEQLGSWERSIKEAGIQPE